MRPCRMIRDGESTTSLAMARHRGRAIEEVEAEEGARTTSDSTTSPSTSTTSSKTLTTLASTNNGTSTTSTPRIKATKRDTLTATSRPTRRPWTDTGGTFSRGVSAADSLTTCSRTWRRCSRSTRKAPGLRTGSRVRPSSTAGQWPSAGATWWPPSPTAPETRTLSCRVQPLGTLSGLLVWNWMLIYHLSEWRMDFVWLQWVFFFSFSVLFSSRNKYPNWLDKRLPPSNNSLIIAQFEFLADLDAIV